MPVDTTDWLEWTDNAVRVVGADHPLPAYKIIRSVFTDTVLYEAVLPLENQITASLFADVMPGSTPPYGEYSISIHAHIWTQPPCGGKCMSLVKRNKKPGYLVNLIPDDEIWIVPDGHPFGILHEVGTFLRDAEHMQDVMREWSTWAPIPWPHEHRNVS